MNRARRIAFLLLALLAASVGVPARAEVTEITVAEQYGLAALPLMVMQHDRLVEKHAAAVGLPSLTVNWSLVSGPSVMNDGLISGAVQFAAQGVPSMATLWERSRRNAGVKGVAAIATIPVYLVSRNPAVRTVRDLSAADKITVPSIKVSTQAVMLQIAAAEAFGDAGFARLDPYTVSLGYPEGLATLGNGSGDINGMFLSSPYYEQAMRIPGVHLVTTSADILGGPATALILTSSARFRDANPRVYRAMLQALLEAIDTINRDKPAAARTYLEMTGDKRSTEADILAVITSPGYAFTVRPSKVLKTAQYMARFGTLREMPQRVEDLFFPEAAEAGGD